jgi:ligand-binding SRPBCC domain-containing protein
VTLRTFAIASRLDAPRERVYAFVTTMAGVNHELWPIARMTHPRGMASLDGRAIPLRTPIFRSWVLLFGVLPIDFDEITFLRFDHEGFSEDSRMLSQRVWRHERTLRDDSGGCVIDDRIEWEPKVMALAPIFDRAFRLTFENRHRRLRARFGGRAAR